MKSWKSLAAAFSLAVVGVLGVTVPVVAEEPLEGDAAYACAPQGDIVTFQIAGQDPVATYLFVEVTPALEGKVAAIRFGPAPYEGVVLRHATLHAGPQMIAVPRQPMSGWFTLQCEGRAQSVKQQTGDDVTGAN